MRTPEEDGGINEGEAVDIEVVDIEGGDVTEVSPDYEVDYKAATTQKLAFILVAILAGSVVLHYGMVTWLLYNDKTAAIAELHNIFGTWLPVISGLAGSAVTYYFTQDK